MTDEQAALLAAVTLLAPHMDPRDVVQGPTTYAANTVSEWASALLPMLDMGRR